MSWQFFSVDYRLLITDDSSRWFLENGLLLNPSKTDAAASRLISIDTSGGVTVAGSTFLQFSDSVKLLGVELDQALSTDRHLPRVVSSCNFNITALRHIRPSFTLDGAKCVAVSIVSSRLDYCHLLLLLSPKTDTHFTIPLRVEGWVDLGTAVALKVNHPLQKTPISTDLA